jgi:protein SCO1/2
MNDAHEDGRLIKALRTLALAGLAAAAVLAVWSATAKRDTSSGLMHYGQLPAFQLVSMGGRPFYSTSLDGKVWIASFVYTSCKASCPMLTAQVKRLAKSLPAGPDYAMVSFTVDPKVDSPEKLRKYAAASGADDPRWYFLTGSVAALKSLITDGFKLVAEPDDVALDQRKSPDIVHSTKLVLIDKHGSVRGYYDGLLGSSVEAVRRDAQLLDRES